MNEPSAHTRNLLSYRDEVEGILEFFTISPSSARTHKELIQQRRGAWELFRDVTVQQIRASQRNALPGHTLLGEAEKGASS